MYICNKIMRTISKLLPLVLLASALSLSSCVNQVKDSPKTQVQDTTKGKDTLSRLVIVYNIPDSNNILSVSFHASMTPSIQKNFRLDWDFGDSSGIIPRFDTNSLIHNFKNFGSHIVSLSVTDTERKILVRKVSDTLLIMNNAIDTNYLHEFTKVSLQFSCEKLYGTILDEGDLGTSLYNGTLSNIRWVGSQFELTSSYSWDYFDTSLGPPNEVQNHYSKTFSVKGQISQTGKQIDSGLFVYHFFSSYSKLHHRGGSDRYINLIYKLIPQIKQDSNSMVFSFSGISLQSFVSEFSDRTDAGDNMDSWVDRQLSKVLWDQPPIPVLTVTFSK